MELFIGAYKSLSCSAESDGMLCVNMNRAGVRGADCSPAPSLTGENIRVIILCVTETLRKIFHNHVRGPVVQCVQGQRHNKTAAQDRRWCPNRYDFLPAWSLYRAQNTLMTRLTLMTLITCPVELFSHTVNPYTFTRQPRHLKPTWFSYNFIIYRWFILNSFLNMHFFKNLSLSVLEWNLHCWNTHIINEWLKYQRNTWLHDLARHMT